jgi:hypothetical protein
MVKSQQVKDVSLLPVDDEAGAHQEYLGLQDMMILPAIRETDLPDAQKGVIKAASLHAAIARSD